MPGRSSVMRGSCRGGELLSTAGSGVIRPASLAGLIAVGRVGIDPDDHL
jgi:hypothetical protein